MTTTTLRRTAAGLLVVTALVHANLYAREDYRAIPTVGWLFLLTVVTAVAAGAALVVRPAWWVDLGAALFSLGVLGAYLLTLWLPDGLFLFKEPGVSYSGLVAIVAEAGAALVLAVVCLRDRQAHRRVGGRPAPA